MHKQHYLDQLTENQRAAVEHFEGPALVYATAGSGKTRVITYRIVHLLHGHGVSPAEIMAVTFTNKAANEMKERVHQLLPGKEAERLHISTFHSMCARILRVQHLAAGLGDNYTICDDSDSKAYVVHAVALETNEDPKKVKGWKDERAPDKVQRFISNKKQSVLLPEDVLDRLDSSSSNIDRFYANCYSRYQATLRKTNSVDFDDLIMKTVLLLRQHDGIREKYASAIRFLMIDEYQDTNPSQYELANYLASVHQNICVVGDDDQSIYAFRGACPENLDRMEVDFPDTKVYFLEDNFRSTQPIADTANELISYNTGRKPKLIKPVVKEGAPVRCIECLDPRQEAAVIVDEMMSLVRSGQASFKDFGILYRMHTRSRVFEELLVANNIPHKIVGGVGFYNRAVVKDIIAYLKLVQNSADEASFLRIYNKPTRGFGDTSYAKLYQIKEERGGTIITTFRKRWYEEVLKGKSLAGAENIREVFHKLYQLPKELVGPLVEGVIDATDYDKALRSAGDQKSLDQLQHLEELVNAAKEFDSAHGSGLLRFLEWTSLMQNTEEEENEDRVHLMTCHAAKGLEFPRLYVVGAIDGVMPIVRDTDDYGRTKSPEMMEKDLQEERRIFFVALTRAERHLTITHAQQEFRYKSVVECTPSRFLEELGETVEHEIVAGTSAGSYLLGALNTQRNRAGGQKKRGYPKRRKQRRRY